jgi:hypothetical protein
LIFNDTRRAVPDQGVHPEDRGCAVPPSTPWETFRSAPDYRAGWPRRWVYLAVSITVFVVPLITQFNFTAISHFSAIFIGLLCYPLTRQRQAISGSRSRS